MLVNRPDKRRPHTDPRADTRCTRTDAGFTLVEVLTALAVFGLLIVTINQGLQLALTALRTQQRAIAAVSDFDAVDRTIRNLIEQMNPGSFRGEPPAFKGTNRSLSFNTELPMGAGTAPTDMADVSLAVDASHRLQLLWRPYFPNPIDGTVKIDAETLVEGVDHIDITYFQPTNRGQGGLWIRNWAGTELPGLIRIRVVFERGGPGPWPDILASPKRQRWRL